jgi:hypothetical protein
MLLLSQTSMLRGARHGRGGLRRVGWRAHLTSTSGLLWRSTICDGKFRRQSAAPSVLRMQFR